MPVTYKKIASVTVGAGGQSAVEFTNIDQTYDDLNIKFSGRTSGNATLTIQLNMEFNGSSTAVYSDRTLVGVSGSASSFSRSSQSVIRVSSLVMAGYVNSTSNTFGSTDIYIPNYRSSNNKSVSLDGVAESNTANLVDANLVAGLWANTSAITSIKFTSQAGDNFVQYTTATLYGIKRS